MPLYWRTDWSTFIVETNKFSEKCKSKSHTQPVQALIYKMGYKFMLIIHATVSTKEKKSTFYYLKQNFIQTCIRILAVKNQIKTADETGSKRKLIIHTESTLEQDIKF